MDTMTIQLGETLRTVRKSVRLSQVELGKLLGVHQAAVCRIEAGTQTLTPDQLAIVCRHFEISFDDFMTAEVDFWSLAERFDCRPPLPNRYTQFPHAKVRELLPLLHFVEKVKGRQFLSQQLETQSVEPIFLKNPDMTIGTRFNLDLLRSLIGSSVLKGRSMSGLVQSSHERSVHGFLYRIYEPLHDPLELIRARVLSSNHYESNFKVHIHEQSKKKLELVVTPEQHMAELNYKDEILGDFLCRYKKEYFKKLPEILAMRKVSLIEKECHFRGKSRCVYKIMAA